MKVAEVQTLTISWEWLCLITANKEIISVCPTSVQVLETKDHKKWLITLSRSYPELGAPDGGVES